MNVLGLIGGTSWHSTIEYYSIINQSVNDYFGNNTNPPLLVFTLNQARIHQFQIENKWESIAYMLVDAAQSLHKAGANTVLFCANTPHKVFDAVQEKLDFPIIHIADATAKAIHEIRLNKVLFLGTKYSMEETFITKRIEDNGIQVLVPEDKKIINELHRIIIEELTYGKIVATSKIYVMKVIEKAMKQGAEGVVLGCTEFPLMIFKEDVDIPIFNTTEIHSKAGVNYILKQQLCR
ncbi:aspartate/glutamate racemase family protein [Allomuricauda sp. F6463D]|uniref:aspartate/glutamate racemase family protein n=1 Tax=Allomuricauda sp. F6463D TaxID=2926409 RepID=UPI001FF42EC2|nr:amino acid racemase [Muricauda sp. F6463D]MCK0160548.1 amino acid racemase [Muricauda sp. F6463D]